MRKEFERQLASISSYLPTSTDKDPRPNQAIAAVIDTAGKKGKTREEFVVPIEEGLSLAQILKLDGHLYHNHSLRVRGLAIPVSEPKAEIVRAGEVNELELLRLGLLTQALYLSIQRISEKERRRIRAEKLARKGSSG